jgi:hypothetical protein
MRHIWAENPLRDVRTFDEAKELGPLDGTYGINFRSMLIKRALLIIVLTGAAISYVLITRRCLLKTSNLDAVKKSLEVWLIQPR